MINNCNRSDLKHVSLTYLFYLPATEENELSPVHTLRFWNLFDWKKMYWVLTKIWMVGSSIFST